MMLLRGAGQAGVEKPGSCYFHLMKNVRSKQNRFTPKEAYDRFMSDLRFLAETTGTVDGGLIERLDLAVDDRRRFRFVFCVFSTLYADLGRVMGRGCCFLGPMGLR